MLDEIRTEEVARLPLAKQQHFAALTALLITKLKQRQFYDLFPDSDRLDNDGSVLIYRRDLYPKHTEFFAAGAGYRERCFLAANRCWGPWSFIETASATVPCLEAVLLKGDHALSWDGVSERVSRFEGAFLKGIEPAFRLVMDNGVFFDCTRGHQLLTSDGWCSLDRLVSLSHGLRSWHRRQDYQANCDVGGYLGDGLPPYWSGSAQGLLPSPTCAQERSLVWKLEDAEERISEHSFERLNAGLQSTPDVLLLLSDLCARFSGPASSTPYLSLSESSQELRQLALELAHRSQSVGVSSLDQYGGTASLVVDQIRDRAGSCMRIVPDAVRRSGGQWCDAQPLGESVQEWFRDAAHIPIFYPSGHPPLIGDRSILAVVPIGYQPIFDATVPDFQSYKAAGVFHHNTGKTTAGSYEMTCHLTGLYPKWWTGKVFHGPVRAWACGRRNETTRDIVQASLLGPVAYEGTRKVLAGTGMVPGGLIGRVTWKRGVDDLIDTVKIKHVSGGWSTLGMKSYEQGRGSFEGTAQHVIWMDEEVDIDVYGECLIRTMTTNGIIILTFTPLLGMTETVQQFQLAADKATLGRM